MKSNKFWLILFGIIILGSIVAVFLMTMPQAAYAQIFKDGELVETINLSAMAGPIEITLESESRTNVIKGLMGKITIAEANCLFQLCTRQGWRNSGVIPIVCLPNRVTVRLISGATTDIDGVVR